MGADRAVQLKADAVPFDSSATKAPASLDDIDGEQGAALPAILLGAICAVVGLAVIGAVIGEFVELKRQGADYRGPCPFHQGTHRNFSVSPKKARRVSSST